jgi:hypothetical protein
MQVLEWDQRNAWISDYHPAGIQVQDAMDEIKVFAYGAFDHLDKDGDGFLDRAELETAFGSLNPLARERSFVLFLLFHLTEIAAAYNEECITRSDGISRSDLDAYFHRFDHKR